MSAIQEWVRSVLSFELDPEKCSKEELISRFQDCAEEFAEFNLTGEEMEELSIRLRQALGVRFFANPGATPPELQELAVSAGGLFLTASANGPWEEETELVVRYFWAGVLEHGKYMPVVIEWMPHQDVNIYSLLLQQLRTDIESRNPLVSSAGTYGIKCFRGASIGESRSALASTIGRTLGYDEDEEYDHQRQ